MNKALREYVESKGGHAEDMMRRVIREELATFFVKRVDREQPGRKERGS
jgi:hypothetical protein